MKLLDALFLGPGFFWRNRVVWAFFFVGPALLFFSIAFLASRPEAWQEAVIVPPVGLIATVLSHTIGHPKIEQHPDPLQRKIFRVAQITGFVSGLFMGGAIYLFEMGLL